MKKIRPWLWLLPILLCTACGAFLQQSGVKNYKPTLRIPSGTLNNYQYDLRYLHRLLESAYPQLDEVWLPEARAISFNEAVSALDGSQNTRPDFELQARRLLGTLNNQHTNIWFEEPQPEAIYPFTVFYSSGDWYLANIDRAQDSLLIGQRIVSLNGTSVQMIAGLLQPFTLQENEIAQLKAVQRMALLSRPRYLKAIGLLGSTEDPLKVKLENGRMVELYKTPFGKLELYRFAFKNNPLTVRRRSTYDYNVFPSLGLAYLQFNAMHDKIDLLDGIGSYVKPWLQPVARGYVKRQFKKEKPSERIAGFYNKTYPVFQEMIHEMIDSLNRSGIDNLVIDLRNNNGGNLTLGIQLLYFLTENKQIKNFKEYAWTSPVYKAYFPEGYKKIKEKMGEVPEEELVLLTPSNNAFTEVVNATSQYHVKADRPVFKGKVYILAHYNTGSAAAMLTTLAQDNDLATTIGTSVGNNPTGATT
ncbi:MAG: S41 family peptidase, partial [Bacteroidota bacterium]